MAGKGLLLKALNAANAEKKLAIQTEFEKAHAIAQKNAALPVDQGGLGLPENNTAMDRARAMGFDVDNRLYHGSTYTDINEFLPEGGGERSKEVLDWYRNRVKNNEPVGTMNFRSGSFFSPQPDYAGHYTRENTGVMYPVIARQENPVVLESVGGRYKQLNEPNREKTLDALNLMGDNGVMNEVAIIEPSNIRSVNAAFDPLKKRSGNILASAGAGAAVAGGALYTPEENQAQAGWINKGGKQVLETWHGTPHEFPPTANNPLGEYDLSKIGTGEGAQAYGHGIYQADVKDVAKGYQEGLTKSISVDGKPIVSGGRFTGTTGNSDIDDFILANGGNIDSAIKDIETILKEDGGIGYIDETYKPLLEELKKLKENNSIQTSTSGSLYRTHSDIQPEEMLDWDKPLSEMPEIEKMIYGDRVDMSGNPLPSGYFGKETGAKAYLTLAERLGGEDKASEYLKSKGIKGIQYNDGLSRGTEGGTKNYVIFDTSKMNIVEKGATTTKGAATLAALSGGANAIYNAAKNNTLGEAANYAQDAANMVGYIPTAGMMTTSDIIGGLGKAGAAATGNLDAYNREVSPYVERAGETQSQLGKQVEQGMGYLIEQATPYVAPYLTPAYNNVMKQWEEIEATPSDANLFGFIDELNRKAGAKFGYDY